MAEACSSLSGAFKSELLTEEQRGELQQLLLTSITSTKVRRDSSIVDQKTIDQLFGCSRFRVQEAMQDG